MSNSMHSRRKISRLVLDTPNLNGDGSVLLPESYLHAIVPILAATFSVSYETGSPSRT